MLKYEKKVPKVIWGTGYIAAKFYYLYPDKNQIEYFIDNAGSNDNTGGGYGLERELYPRNMRI